MVSILEKPKKCFSHSILEFFTTHREAAYEWVADECILILTSITTGVSFAVNCPKPKIGDASLLPCIAVIMEDC